MKTRIFLALCLAIVLAAGWHFRAVALNQSGLLSREEPFSFWTAISLSDTQFYGPFNNTKAIDGVFFSATAGQTLVVLDQAGNNVTWTFGSSGTYFLPISPSKFPATGGGTVTGIVAAYK